MVFEVARLVSYRLGTDGLLLVVLGFNLLLLVLVGSAFLKIARVAPRNSLRSTGPTPADTHSGQRAALSEILSALDQLAAAGQEEREAVRKCVQQVGIVRYNAFDDVGSDLSFSAALLDARGDGIVITAICGREESRVYAKPLIEFSSPYPLSEEESRAISQARSGGVRSEWGARRTALKGSSRYRS